MNQWNKDVSLQRSLKIIKENKQVYLHEATARKHAKRYLIHTQGNICSICKTETWNNKPVPLVCDHINGDSSDNKIENFRIICCNCDAQLPTYKSKNKNGRKYDRDYMNKRNNGVHV